MRGHALALGLAVTLVPLAAAAPPIGLCNALFCAHAQDTDGDGEYDWASFASSVEHAGTLNANYGEGVLLVQAHASSEETLDPYHTASAYLLVDKHENGGVDDAWLLVELSAGDEKTGETETLYWRLVRATDTDGDGLPDTLATEPSE